MTKLIYFLLFIQVPQSSFLMAEDSDETASEEEDDLVPGTPPAKKVSLSLWMLFKIVHDAYRSVLPAYLVPAHLPAYVSRHFFRSPLPLTYVILKSDILSSGYLFLTR